MDKEVLGEQDRLHGDAANDETPMHLLRRFFEILNEHTSEVTGWPRYRIVKLKNGRTKRWRTSHERHDAYVHSRFIKTDLLRVNLQRHEFPNDGLVSFKDYYKGFFRSKNPFVWAVRKEFLIKTLVLGCIAIDNQ